MQVPHGQNATRAEQVEKQGTHMITGEVMRVEDTNYFVKEKSGKEVTLKTDHRTAQPVINQGDHISANVDDQNSPCWIRSNKMTDRRTEHASVTALRINNRHAGHSFRGVGDDERAPMRFHKIPYYEAGNRFTILTQDPVIPKKDLATTKNEGSLATCSSCATDPLKDEVCFCKNPLDHGQSDRVCYRAN